MQFGRSDGEDGQLKGIKLNGSKHLKLAFFKRGRSEIQKCMVTKVKTGRSQDNKIGGLWASKGLFLGSR